MFLSGLGTALPSNAYSKAQCWDAFRTSVWYDKLDRRARAITQAVLQHDNGIEVHCAAGLACSLRPPASAAKTAVSSTRLL